MDEQATEILEFWLGEVGPDGWYAPPEGLDARIRERYAALWEEGRAGRLAAWTHEPRSLLALVILLDQFPRNMFRGEARAFASDARALGYARRGIGLGFDRRVDMPERHFFYLPLAHSELVSDQNRCVRLTLLHCDDAELLRHARAHRDTIRRFGRFPTRNAALGRVSTPAEARFLAEGGYSLALKELSPV